MATVSYFGIYWIFSCGVDQYLFRTPQYSADLHTAFLVIHSRF